MRARVGAMLSALLFSWGTAHAQPILFLSTQLTPVAEAGMMRQSILKGFLQPVDFEPSDRTVYNARVRDIVSNPGSPVVLGGMREDFLDLYRAGALASVDTVWPKLSERKFLPGLDSRGTPGRDHSTFIPWMQATYLMAANRHALQYLPKGADLNRLTYEQLKEWAARMYRATGKGMLGFPAGQKGLMPRFLQGFLSPSFTGSMEGGIGSASASDMWKYLRGLWEYVAPSSLILNRMDEALLNDEVWVAWDHTARLLEAFKERPDEFVAFPAPVGPSGRGFITVLAGLGVPRGSSSASAEQLIEYLTRPSVQVTTLESVGFLPVVEIGGGSVLPKGLSAIVHAAAEQLSSPDAIPSSIPLRTADSGRSYDLVYMVAFSQIVLRNQDTQKVLDRQARVLRGLDAGARSTDSP